MTVTPKSVNMFYNIKKCELTYSPCRLPDFPQIISFRMSKIRDLQALSLIHICVRQPFTQHYIQRVFKFNIKVAFKTNNNISNLLRIKQPLPLEDKTGVYRISCNDCDCFYLGQTGKSFLKRYKEHLSRNDLDTVSYTHLDVYKRQLLQWIK